MGTWAEAVDGAFAGRVALERGGADAAELAHAERAGVEVLALGGASLAVSARAAADFPARWSLLAQLAGEVRLSQLGGAWVLAPGDVVLIDARAATTLDASGSFAQAALLLPARLLPAEVRPGRLATEGPVERLLFEALAAVPACAGSAEAERLLGVLPVLAREARLPTAPLSSTGEVRVRRALRRIEAELADPSFDAERLARAEGVSRRRLDAAFAARGTTAAAALQEARLQRAASLLADGRLGVAEVALGAGFPSAGALSHAFRRRFGVSPRAWRHAPADHG